MSKSVLFTDEPALMYVLIGVMGATNGLLAGVVGYYVDATFLNLHAAVWAFLLVWAATTGYLSYERVPSGVLAVGLYFVVLFVLLQPLAVYGPALAAATGEAGVSDPAALSNGFQGLAVWGATAGILALALTAVSRLLKRRAEHVLGRRQRRRLRWQDD